MVRTWMRLSRKGRLNSRLNCQSRKADFWTEKRHVYIKKSYFPHIYRYTIARRSLELTAILAQMFSFLVIVHSTIRRSFWT